MVIDYSGKKMENTNFAERTTSKDDEDPILELRDVDMEKIENNKMSLADVPFYAASTKELLALTLHRLEAIRDNNKTGTFYGVNYILPLNPYTFSKMRKSRRYFYLTRESFINLPAGAGMVWMSKRLKKPLPETVRTIAYVMSLIRLANAKEYTIFIVGSKYEILDKLASNLHRSFPNLRLVGKHHGYLKGEGHQRIMEALQKTDPHIILLGMGYKKELQWISQNKHVLGNCVLVNVGGSLDILAGIRKKAPAKIELSGYTWLWRIVNNPFRYFRIFTVFSWFLKTIWWSLTHSKGEVKFH